MSLNPPPDLLARARAVLLDLKLLSDAGTQLITNRVTHSKPDHKAPPPVEDLHGLHKREFALWFKRRLTVGDVDEDFVQFRGLVAAAERDRDEARYRPPLRVDEDGKREIAETRSRRILREYEGTHYAEAAARERVEPEHIYALRTEAKREPVYGAR